MPHATDKDQPSHQDWGTPQAFFDAIASRFRFTLDVCASDYNHKADRYYTQEQDGLLRPWWPNECCWCNPPYGNNGPWFERGWQAAKKGSTVVYLVPASTDTEWFCDLACKGDLYFVKGRLKFDPPPGYDGEEPGPNFGSCVVVYTPELARGERDPVVSIIGRNGNAVQPSRKMVQASLW